MMHDARADGSRIRKLLNYFARKRHVWHANSKAIFMPSPLFRILTSFVDFSPAIRPPIIDFIPATSPAEVRSTARLSSPSCCSWSPTPAAAATRSCSTSSATKPRASACAAARPSPVPPRRGRRPAGSSTRPSSAACSTAPPTHMTTAFAGGGRVASRSMVRNSTSNARPNCAAPSASRRVRIARKSW